ncbi:hypothetical protein C7212DRAFT_343079 [Tuber magnatum]|uniref:Uncharacterized protein n=1 Tax=Tuber magnatum TaxID=42249 RepID=A0A317SVS6_9PEZI|nr:hypothetical protein C7212DRAFT_343079 [Tuber magnatum]
MHYHRRDRAEDELRIVVARLRQLDSFKSNLGRQLSDVAIEQHQPERPATCTHDLQLPDAPRKLRRTNTKAECRWRRRRPATPCPNAPGKPRCTEAGDLNTRARNRNHEQRPWEARDACGYSEMESWSGGIAEWIQGWTWVYGGAQCCEGGDWGGDSGMETWNGDYEGDMGVDTGLLDCDQEIMEWVQGMGSVGSIESSHCA